jgi:hypothetical protein
MTMSSRSLPGEKEFPDMRLPANARVIATSFVLAALSVVTFVATVLADSTAGPIPR